MDSSRGLSVSLKSFQFKIPDFQFSLVWNKFEGKTKNNSTIDYFSDISDT